MSCQDPFLPIEILHQIISYVPINSMKNLKLSCKSFYAYCSKLQKFLWPLGIKRQWLDDDKMFYSMMFSLRQFNEAWIELGSFSSKQINRIKAVLMFQGLSITSVTFLKSRDVHEDENFNLSQFGLTSWLNLMPNLERIEFYGYSNVVEFFDGSQARLNLPKLKNVKFPPIGLGQKLHHSKASSLESLILVNPTTLPNLNDIFQTHRETLKELRFDLQFLYTDSSMFHQLQLETLEFHMDSHRFWLNRIIVDIVNHQVNLRKLCLGSIESSECIFVTTMLLRSICDLKHLEKLELGINPRIPLHEITQMNKLKKLKKLRIEFDETTDERQELCMEVFSTTSLPSLRSLEISGFIELHSLINMKSSFPGLEKFHGDLYLNAEDHRSVGSINVILNTFPKLKKLVLLQSDSYFQPTGDIFTNMKILKLLCDDGNTEVTAELIKALPNLEVIQVEQLIPRVDMFQALLQSNVFQITIKIPFNVLKNVVELKKLKRQLIRKCKFCCSIRIVKY